MVLEFELREFTNKSSRAVYLVLHKGLEVGLLYLDAPYNEVELKDMEVNLK